MHIYFFLCSWLIHDNLNNNKLSLILLEYVLHSEKMLKEHIKNAKKKKVFNQEAFVFIFVFMLPTTYIFGQNVPECDLE